MKQQQEQSSSKSSSTNESKSNKKKRSSTAVDNDVTTTEISNKKRALKRERQSHRPHFDVVLRSKEIWNQLRTLTTSFQDADKVGVLMQELMVLLKDKLAYVALQHDASRVVQAMIKYGDAEQCVAIFDELLPVLVEMSKSTYAHFIVLKLLSCKHWQSGSKGKSSKAQNSNSSKLYKAWKGQVVKLATHAIGARVLEVALMGEQNQQSGSGGLSAKHKRMLRKEFYGREFSIFDDAGEDLGGGEDGGNKNLLLEQIISNVDDSKKEKLLQQLENLLVKCCDKGAVHYIFYQDLLFDYTGFCHKNKRSPSNDVISSVADHAIHLLSTRNGSLALCMLIAHGTAKDRKRVIKTLKGYTAATLQHSSGK